MFLFVTQKKYIENFILNNIYSFTTKKSCVLFLACCCCSCSRHFQSKNLRSISHNILHCGWFLREPMLQFQPLIFRLRTLMGNKGPRVESFGWLLGIDTDVIVTIWMDATTCDVLATHTVDRDDTTKSITINHCIVVVVVVVLMIVIVMIVV